MGSVALSGNDTIKIGTRLITDLADQDNAVLEFENDIAVVKTGKNGNSIFAQNQTGNQGKLTLRVIRGSADDKYLNSQLILQQNNFQGAVLTIGEFVKRVGDGLGNVTADTYAAAGGVYSKKVGAKSNSEGDTEQSVSIYEIRFATVVRVLT